MTEETGSPLAENDPAANRRTSLIILAVLVLVLLCCCCLALVLAWSYGDSVLNWINEITYLPALT